MKKRPLQNVLIERLHKGVVIACLGITLYGVGHLGLRWIRYFTVLRPELKARELQEKQSLLSEGSSELLQDNSKSLTL